MIGKKVAAVFICCFLLAGCVPEEAELLSKYNEMEQLDNIEYYFQGVIEEDKIYDLLFVVDNNSGKEILCGELWCLEKLDEDNWYAVSFMEGGMRAEDYGIILPTGKTENFIVSLYGHYATPIESGTYRVVQQIKKDKIIALEFEL